MSAAALIRESRMSAGLTQQQLAVRAQIPQSTVSAYERGRRDPGFAAFERLIEAAGSSVRIGQSRALDTVRARREELLSALKPYGVTRVRVFGSVARGQERPDSDVDLLVDIERAPSLLILARMTSEASEVLGSSVDLVPVESLRASIRDEVLREAVPL